MANRVKGITIDIGGNVTGLDKALKDVNSNIRTTSRSLKDVERLLKIDPKNTELLAQKQKLLADAVGQTKNKLTQLQAAEKQAKEALENGDLGQDKYDALQREIIETENELKRLEGQQKDTEAAINGSAKTMSDKMKEAGEKIQDAGGKLQDVGGKMKEAGKAMTTHVTAPIVAGAAASVAAFNEVDAAADILTAKTGAQGKAFEDMKAIMEDIATTIPTDFETAANAVGEVNTRFGATGEQLQDLSTRFIEFSELNNTEVSSSIDNTQKALSAFGLGAESAGMLLDVLNRTGQNTGVSMDSLTNGLIQNGAAFQEMGLSIDQATVFMGQMEKSGANSETVMQGLRKALKNATADGIPMNQALQDLQNTIQNGTGSVDGLTASYELFGKSGDQIYAAVKNGTLDFTALASSQSILKDSTDSVAKSYQDTVDPIDEAKTAMNDAKLIGADIVTTAAPMIRDALAAIRDVIKDLRSWWSGLSEDEQQNILKMAGIAAAVGPVLTVLGSLAGIIGTVVSVVGALLPMLGAVAAGIGAIGAPVLVVIGVIAALVAGIVLLAKNWDKVREAAGKFTDGVKKRWGELKDSTKSAVDDMGKRWNQWKTDTGKKLSDTVAGAKAKFAEMKQNAGTSVENIRSKAGSAWESLKQKTSSSFGKVKELITNQLSKASQNGQKYSNTISSKLSSAWDRIKEKTGSSFGNVRDTMGDLMGKAKDKVKGAIDKIRGFFNFSWSLPRLKLPHPRVSGRFSLNPPSVPSFSIDWYDKAMKTGRILKGATIFGMMNGKLLGGGETGSETVVGTESLMDMIQNAVASAMNAIRSMGGSSYAAAMQSSGVTVSYGDINMTINGAAGQDVRELANIVSERIRTEYDREAKTWA